MVHFTCSSSKSLPYTRRWLATDDWVLFSAQRSEEEVAGLHQTGQEFEKRKSPSPSAAIEEMPAIEAPHGSEKVVSTFFLEVVLLS